MNESFKHLKANLNTKPIINYITKPALCLLVLVSLMLSLCSVSAQNVLTQDWTPFPANQKTYFEFSNETLKLPALYYATNVSQQGDQVQYYLDANNTVGELGEISDDCAEDYTKQAQDFVSVLEPFTEQHGLHYYQGQLVFNTNLTVGEGFFVQSENYMGFDEVYIECIEQRTENVFGQNDEVKEFNLRAYSNGQPVVSDFDKFTYILSKSFGFLQFLPFTELLNQPKTTATLNGFEDAEGNLVGNNGEQFVPPYEVGDVIYYSESVVYSRQSKNTKNWRDSITAVIVYEDSLIYTFNRLEINKLEEWKPSPSGLDTIITIETQQSSGNQNTYFFNGLADVYNSIYGYHLSDNYLGYIYLKQNSFSFNNQVETTLNISFPTVFIKDGCTAYSSLFTQLTGCHSALGQISTFYADDCCITEQSRLEVYKKGDQIYSPFVELNPVYNITDSPVDLINDYYLGCLLYTSPSPRDS